MSFFYQVLCYITVLRVFYLSVIHAQCTSFFKFYAISYNWASILFLNDVIFLFAYSIHDFSLQFMSFYPFSSELCIVFAFSCCLLPSLRHFSSGFLSVFFMCLSPLCMCYVVSHFPSWLMSVSSLCSDTTFSHV